MKADTDELDELKRRYNELCRLCRMVEPWTAEAVRGNTTSRARSVERACQAMRDYIWATPLASHTYLPPRSAVIGPKTRFA